MSRTKVNLISGLAATAWSALLQIALIPVYIHFLGVEAYGLVGFYVLLNSVIQVLDLGVSPTTSREMARYSVQPNKANEACDFVRTYEVGYWVVGILIGISIFASAPLISTQWLNANNLPTSVVLVSVQLMGVAIALQWPVSFYQGALLGLQRQSVVSFIAIGTLLFRAVLTVFTLTFVASSVGAFFICQIIASVVQLTLNVFFCWRYMPPSSRTPQVAPRLLQQSWRFAVGMSGISLFGLILSQVDKVVVSRLLSLEAFSFYALAAVVSSGLTSIALPLFHFTFPRLSAAVQVKDQAKLKSIYHQSAQLMAVLILPIAVTCLIFPRDILMFWTRNPEIASNSASIVQILVVGTILNSFMVLPYALQLAHGWTKFGVVLSGALATLVLLLIVPMAQTFGGVGAALTWMLSNALYMLVGAPVTHNRLLKGEMRDWLLKDVGIPLFVTILICVVWSFVTHSLQFKEGSVFKISCGLALSLVAVVTVTPRVRVMVTTLPFFTRVGRRLRIAAFYEQ